MKIVHLDYEGRSGVDITDVGSHRWSIDPQFEIFMAGVSADEPDAPVLLWINPKFRTCDEMGDNEEAEALLESADLVYAHNAPNEQANTWGALKQRKACPFKKEPPLTVWRCTAAMARKAGLPFSLEKLSEALSLGDLGKSREGKELIRFFCIPDEKGFFQQPHAHPERWNKFCEYCRQDVRAEKQAGRLLKPFELTGAALATFQFDLRMNQRGIPINMTAARNAQRVISEVQGGVVEEFRKITGINPTQRDKFIDWMKTNCGLELPNTQAATIDTTIEENEKMRADALKDGRTDWAEIAEKRLHLLGLYQKVSYAAVKKVQTMLDCACPDDRLRGMFMYHGAGTGRWTAQKLQPQNFKKTPPWMRTKEDDITDAVYQAFCDGMPAYAIDQLYGDPLEVLSGIIRNFIHLPGTELLDGDFAQVEARIICWLAGQLDVLERWRLGEDLYKWMAGHVYGIPADQVTPDQREVGKRIILGAGFQMGWRKFQSSCKIQYQLDVPTEICKKGIKMFRSLCKKIRDYWWSLNNAATQAIETGQPCGPFSTRRIAGIPYLLFRLRSGRSLAYPHPEVKMTQWVPDVDEDDVDEFGEPIVPEVKWRKEITYWGQIPGSGQWGRIKLYGGKLAENETQATAADFMAHGSITAESRGMEPFMLVHDQGLALRTNDQTTKDYEAALGTLPGWAIGFPMKVEAKIAKFYKK